MNTKLIYASCSALMLMSCQPKNIPDHSTELDGQWTITAIDDTTIATGEIPAEMQIYVDRLTFAANAGCNNMNGAIVVDTLNEYGISFDLQAVTRMMCPDMNNEQKLQLALEKVVKFSLDTTGVRKVVTLLGSSNEKLVKLEFLKKHSTDEWSLKGNWHIRQVMGKDIENTESVTELYFDLQNNIVSGNAGCNSIGGSLDLGDYTMKFCDVNLTQQMCDQASMDVEASIIEALNSVSQWAVENGELLLENINGDVVMILYRE